MVMVVEDCRRVEYDSLVDILAVSPIVRIYKFDSRQGNLFYSGFRSGKRGQCECVKFSDRLTRYKSAELALC